MAGLLRMRSLVAIIVAAPTALACSVLTDLEPLSGAVDASNEVGGSSDAAILDGVALDDGAVGDVETDGANVRPSRYRDVILDDVPLAYWRLGEPAGTLHAHDETGHGNEGTYLGGVELETPGVVPPDPSVHLDGTGTISIGDKLDLAGDVPFSLELWIALEGGTAGFISKRTYGIGIADDSLLFQRFGDTEPHCSCSSHPFDGGALSDGQFHHVVATYDTQTMKIYVDGTLSGNAVCSMSTPDNTEPLLFGQYFVGRIDEVAIYDRALPTPTVKKHFDARSGP